MKIYFAYRTGYKENLRYIKAFESDSILDFFRDNWELLKSDDYAKLLGTDVYGFPFSFFREEDDDSKPNTFSELLKKIENGIYVNEITGDESSISIHTDDDEIELMWYFFTEDFKNNNVEKTAIWFNEILPTLFGENGKDIVSKDISTLENRGTENGATYFLSSSIYDSGNLEDVRVLKIEGVRLDGLISFLRSTRLKENSNTFYGISELNYMGVIANSLQTDDLETVLKMFAKYPLTEFEGDMDSEDVFDRIKQQKLRNIPEKSYIMVSSHLAETSVNSIGEFYNYFIFMDDLWIEKNEVLAKSIVHFGTELKLDNEK